jgi:GTP-binding protein
LREDDQRIIEFIVDEGKALVIAVNKWDLVKNLTMDAYNQMLIDKMNTIKNFPVIFVSCKTRRNVLASLDLIWSVYERSGMVIPPEELSIILKDLNNSPELKNRGIKFKYLAQRGVNPPTFALVIKETRMLNGSLRRNVENFFRRIRDFSGVSLRINYEAPSQGTARIS